MSMVEYYAIEDALVADGIPYSPAELHGQLVGRFVCGAYAFSLEAWLQELAEETATEVPIKAWSSLPLLAQLCADLVHAWHHVATLELSPFLPDDEVDLRDRLEALAAWANGFLVGLAFGGLRSSDMDNDLREMLDDLRAIGQVDTSVVAEGEAAEKQWVTLVEYVRVAVFHLLETDRSRVQRTKAPSETSSSASHHRHHHHDGCCSLH